MIFRTVVSIVMLMLATLLSACGGAGGDWRIVPQTNPDEQPLAAGVHKLTFSAISTARLDAPISGVEVAVKLPAGLSVSTLTGGTGQITPAAVTQGSALQDTSLAFGNYSASTRTAYLAMSTPQNNYRSGQYLTMQFAVAAGSMVTPNDIYALNATYPMYKVVGLDTINHSSVVLTGKVKTILGVTGL